MRTSMLALAVALLAAPAFAQVIPAPDRRPDEGGGPYEKLAIRGAMLVDGTGAPPYGPVTVVVSGNRIESVGRFAGRADRTINADGMYLMPGFVDMHAHTGDRNKAPEAEYVYKLWLAHGVTTVRGVPLGPGAWARTEKRRSAANAIVAPRIFDYQVPPESARRSPAAAREWVREQAEAGVDGLKLFGYRPPVMRALLEEAAAQQMGSVAHLAQTNVAWMNALDAAELGLRDVTHYYGHFESLLRDYVVQPWPADHNHADEQHRFGQVARLWDQVHAPGSEQWAAYLRRHLERGTVFTPTMCIYSAARDVMRARRAEWHDAYTLPSLMEFFEPSRTAHGSFMFSWTTADEVAWRNFYRVWMQLVNDYKKLGGRVTVGSDSGFIYDTYGFGYIEELEMLQEAGFHPLEVVQAATLNGARTLCDPRGEEPEFGMVREGMLADMVLVPGNPLADFKLLYGTGTLRLDDDTGEVVRAGGVRWTIKDGIVYDARRLRAEVRAMVARQKRERDGGSVTADALDAAAPVAKVEPTKLAAHGDERIDPYYWLRQPSDEAVLDYLRAENAYADTMLAPAADLRQELYDEMIARLPETELSAPYRDGDWWYLSRVEPGEQYRSVYRKRGSRESADEELVLDANVLANGYEFFSLRGVEPNDAHDVVAFATDTVGRRLYTLQFKDLRTGKILKDRIDAVTGNFAWAGDGKHVLYTRQDPETLRSDRVFCHAVGADPSTDRLIYTEPDETYFVQVRRSKSKRYLFIRSEQTLRSEVRYVKADNPLTDWDVFESRDAGDIEYDVEDAGDRWLIRTNLDAPDFRLMQAPLDATDLRHWKPAIEPKEGAFFVSFDACRDFVVLAERIAGLVQLRVVRQDAEDSEDVEIEFDEPAYSLQLNRSRTFDASTLRFTYSSMTTPRAIYDYDVATGVREPVVQDAMRGGFDPSDYVVERLSANARDGEAIPISLVRRADAPRDGENPLLLYAYGSYGSTIDPGFRPDVISLLDRGCAFAIAHVRGSQVGGRASYEDGKLLKKKNTFFDFIDASEFLIKESYVAADKLFARGGSAGGLLIGAIVNMRPDLYAGVIAGVPFVDVVTTMMDATIPLTTFEYDEWGNPADKAFYDYMLSYSPYDNVTAQAYPNMLVTTGLHDSQVQYWEPAKWVAKLRAMKTDSNLLLLRTDMSAGHGGASGRFERYRDIALQYAFLLEIADRR